MKNSLTETNIVSNNNVHVNDSILIFDKKQMEKESIEVWI